MEVTFLQFLFNFILFSSEAFNNRVAVTILRVPGGLDYSFITDEEYLNNHIDNDLTTEASPNRTITSDGNLSIDSANDDSVSDNRPFTPRKSIITQNVNENIKDSVKTKQNEEKNVTNKEK